MSANAQEAVPRTSSSSPTRTRERTASGAPSRHPDRGQDDSDDGSDGDGCCTPLRIHELVDQLGATRAQTCVHTHLAVDVQGGSLQRGIFVLELLYVQQSQ